VVRAHRGPRSFQRLTYAAQALSSQSVMTTLNRSRALLVVGISLAGYSVSLLCLGLALGFDHGAERWLAAAALAALAVGMTASFATRFVILVVEPAGRRMWWTAGPGVRRVWGVVSMMLRAGVAIACWVLAIKTLGT
jgi:hypothetical protein